MGESYEHVPKVLPSSIPVPSNVITVTSYVWYVVQRWFFRIPGAHYVADYVAKSHQDDPYRTIVEIGLIIYGIIYYLSKPWKQGQETQSRLSAKEIDQLVEEWEPEPLVVNDERSRWRLGKIPVVKPASGEGLDSCLCDVSRGENEHYEGVVNLASNDYLRVSRRPEVLAEVKKTIRNYGVGACGPAGFYGNQDQHYNLEYELAAFFGTEGAVLYGQDFCAAPSVIPAFTKRGDVIVADDQVSVALQNALQLSRSTVYYFKHNDMKSLEELLSDLDEHERAERLPTLPRKFIVTEGLFHNIGDIAPLPELVKLKRAYRYRLIVDEMHSIGVLGRTGRGLPEHFNMERSSSIDITIGSMATALGASGAFVLGDSIMTHHQRIGSNAYCFSASLPPYICAAVREVLRIMDCSSLAVDALRKNSNVLYDCFKNETSLKGLVQVVSDPSSSVLHLQITPSLRSSLFGSSEKEIYEEASTYQARSVSNKYVDAWEREERFLQQVVDRLLKEDNILISRNTISLKHHSLPVLPGLKVICNAEISKEQLVQCAGSIREALLTCIDDNSSSTN